ncbi:bifunctional diaminohydroxyphosphoribosylaminopyrimidine deaminase/5-amino-6-(5-phosphoribosylamino)uracil reductase RibD [Thauera mechernichensis]|uniref:Riboflavin biosynthesis protein RibD n=1 Tax=Thauera mechernichensis TaxID=82788 RepID=A0ABW3WIK3_9RHOO|nr:bifunctional diaminohydroxyphosphoribosylaminopyrimidine deaminase/5-amino-6-(5-phosphoribosylamino)uracil reductase RibD [Thauera mechernichensis]MDG3066408.1 bifunctional diaminohydroxyphosphoribosylaminopyrimidine deaminase/5-amino-6-(5-phosphoribosylamino)uracil reductase RibD [Thauera mechernichensis]
MTFSATDHAAMARALALARRGLESTSPNPRVGCVLLRDGRTVGEGWHQRAGEPHAEIHALQQAGADARGATAYVTLEPCSHFGRTPPCADALIEAGVSRVVAAMEDPNPLVAGRGMARLRAAGIVTEHGLLDTEARELNIGFVSRMTRGRPWLRLKAAATLDGKTALNNGVSQWITGAEARRDGHRWRARACAILTGIGTVREDDPQLTVRDIVCERQPQRILIDARLEVPAAARILQGAPILIATACEEHARMAPLLESGHQIIVLPDTNGKVALPALMRELGRLGFNEIHAEAGLKLNGSLLREGCVDELLLYFAPMLAGDTAQGLFNLPALTRLDDATQLDVTDMRTIGRDLRVIARPRR